MEHPVPFISRVRLRNFKSIAVCDVRLGPLTILIGPNGSGKSNFMQALALLGRAVSTTPSEAVTDLGGLDEIVRRVPERKRSFSIDIEATVPEFGESEPRVTAEYGFEIGYSSRPGLRTLEVIRETCALRLGRHSWRFEVDRGSVRQKSQASGSRDIQSDRLYLPFAGIEKAFASLPLELGGMRFYNFSLDTLREPARPSDGAILDSRGEHLSDVIGALAVAAPELKSRVDAYLNTAVPGIDGVDSYAVGGYMTLMFRASGGPGHADIEFAPTAISDGTIRAAAVLAALFQPATADRRIPLIGIEEPEIALHPAASGVLFDALTEASEQLQIVVTTQSPDLLDRDDLDVSTVRAVSMEDGVTRIGRIDRASRQIVAEKLYTLGELMRGNQLSPADPSPGQEAEA